MARSSVPKSRVPNSAELVVGDVIDYRPRVTGGVIVGVVTSIHGTGESAAVTFRITDGNSLYRTGSTECVFACDVSLPS